MEIENYYGYFTDPDLISKGPDQNFTRWGFQCGRYGAEFRTRFLAFRTNQEFSDSNRLSPFSQDITYLVSSGTTYDDELSAWPEVPCVYYSIRDAAVHNRSSTDSDLWRYASCLLANAQVRLANGSSKRVDEISIGDHVDAGGTSSSVFMFTHADPYRKQVFVRIRTDSGSELQLTHGHYLYVNGALRTAGSVQLGDRLRRIDGVQDNVKYIDTVFNTGLYNPQTLHGDIAVHGFIVSTYTELAHPLAAHPMLAPLRVIYRLLDVSILIKCLAEN